MAVQAVLADKPRDGWAYTIGRMRRGLPELVVLGLDPYVAQNLLNFIDENWDDVLNGDHDDSWQLIPIPDRIWETTTYLAGADRDAEERNLERLAMQVVWADDEEGFPWDPDFDRKVAKPQRILGLLP